MPYELAGEVFQTKDAITDRCRQILSSVSDGENLDSNTLPFLFDLFRHHDEWTQKASCGIQSITTQTTPHGTRCFILVRVDGSTIDISFPHAIKLIPTARKSNRLPQKLIDYKDAARTAIQTQIYAFRDKALLNPIFCPYSGEALARENSAVDHIAPQTFDQLLFNFSKDRNINPLRVLTSSQQGTITIFTDTSLMREWQNYHQENANLRLISRIANLQLPKSNAPWECICETRFS